MTATDVASPRNTTASYGAVTKTFHWLTALLVLTAIPLGIIANGLPYETGEELARKALIFSIHKTVGITAFFVALARILWAVTQPKPGPLHPERRAETLLAATVHWTLYGALVLVPLTGWIHHAATEGFAPIWWPFGQSLPGVPKDDSFAHTFASLHIIFERVLVASILLHVLGALKHQFVDRDATLGRMWFGTRPAPEVAPHRASALPLITAVGAYAVALAIGAGLGLFAKTEASAVPQVALAEVASGWTVETGTLGITVTQLGSPVQGQFEDWTAAIEFDEATGTGAVTVTVGIPSLTLGSVTGQALDAEFFDAATYPTATYAAQIAPAAEGYLATGTLTLKGTEVPLNLPFDLAIEGDEATMAGTAEVNRLDFNIGPSYPDEKSVAFAVAIDVALTARRGE